MACLKIAVGEIIPKSLWVDVLHTSFNLISAITSGLVPILELLHTNFGIINTIPGPHNFE